MSEDTKPLTFCHIGPSRKIPCLSAFVLKLETYFRMTKIEYTNDIGLSLSSKGKVPFIKIGEKEIADSNIIIPYLNKKHGKDLNASLSNQQKAISTAFKRLIEENLYWSHLHYRWIESFSTFSKELPLTGVRRVFIPMVWRQLFKSNLKGHGMGRHSVDEIHEIAVQDLRALSVHLGENNFFMGSETTEIDASLFGLLAQIVYATPGYPQEKLMNEELHNLINYTHRMRECYFPDWDQVILHDEKNKNIAAEKRKTEQADEKLTTEINGNQQEDSTKKENVAEDQAQDIQQRKNET